MPLECQKGFCFPLQRKPPKLGKQERKCQFLLGTFFKGNVSDVFHPCPENSFVFLLRKWLERRFICCSYLFALTILEAFPARQSFLSKFTLWFLLFFVFAFLILKSVRESHRWVSPSAVKASSCKRSPLLLPSCGGGTSRRWRRVGSILWGKETASPSRSTQGDQEPKITVPWPCFLPEPPMARGNGKVKLLQGPYEMGKSPRTHGRCQESPEGITYLSHVQLFAQRLDLLAQFAYDTRVRVFIHNSVVDDPLRAVSVT